MASPILDQYRKIAPGTEEFSDEALAEELRKNFYPDSDPEQFKANVGVTRDITQRPIDRYRAQVPQTWGMSDQELVSNLHAKFGGNRPVDEYARDFGVEFNSEPARPEQMTPLVNEPNNPEGRRFSAEERPEGEGFSAVTDTVGSLFGETQPTPSGQTDAARTDARTPEPTDSPARSQSRRNARPDNAQPIAEEPAETRRDDANISELPGEVSQFETRRSRRQNRPDALTFSDITDAVGDAAEGVNLRGTNVGFQAGTQQLAGAIAEGTGVTAQRYSNVRDAIDIDLATYNIAATEAAYENSLSEAETEQEKQEVAREYENRLANLRSDLNSSLESWQSQEPGAVASFMRDLGETMQGYAQETMQDEDFQRMSPIAQDISSGAGSIVPFLSLSLVGNVATRGAGPTAKIIGRYLPALTAASAQGVSEQYQRAIRAGLSEEEAIGKAIQGAPAGALQIAPIASLLKPLPAELRGKAIGQIVTIARTGGSEAVAEGGGVTLQNLIEKSYNPERGTWDNTAYNAAIGGLVGSGTQAAVQLATGGDGVNASAQDDVLDGIDVPSPDSGTPNTPIAIEDQQASERAQEPGANDALSFAVTNPEVDSPDPASAEPDPNQTADSAAAEQPTEETSAPVTDNLPQQAPDQVPDAVLDTAAPAADLPDVQTTLANINQRIQERAQELRSAGVPGDQIQSDQTIVSLSQQAQSLANVDRQTRSQQAEQNANNTIDSARAPVNDALGLQVESIREEADIRSPLRDEIQRLRARSSRPSVLPEVSAIDPAQAPETTERPSRREPTPLIPDATVTPTVRSNGRPFATEASLRRSAPFRNAVSPEIVPVEDGFGFIDRSQPDSRDPTPATTQTPTLSAPDSQTQPGSVEAFPTLNANTSQSGNLTGQNVEPIDASSESAIRDGSPVGDQNNVTQMRNPRDEARYNRNQIIRETAFQMERLVDLESQDSPFNRARIAEVRSTIDDLVSQRDAIDRQYPELATAEQERAQQNQEFDAPDSFTEGVNQALEGAVDDFFVEDLAIRIEESGEQAVEEAVDQLEEVATFGLAETMDGYQPNDFERQIIRRRARQSVNRALGRDQDAAFSRSDEPAGGLDLNEAMSYVDGLMSEWQNAPEVVVAQNESDLPAGLQNRIDNANAQGEIRGIIVSGRIYLIADNLSSRAEVEETLFHEVIRHYGMREILGENYNDFMDEVYIKVGRSAIEPFAKYNGLNIDADDSVERARARRLASEELLAHTTEEELGSRLFTRLVNLVTDWLRRMGFRIRMTAFEIRDLLQRAKMYVEDGEFVTGTSVVEKSRVYRGERHPEADPVFSKKHLDSAPSQFNFNAERRQRNRAQRVKLSTTESSLLKEQAGKAGISADLVLTRAKNQKANYPVKDGWQPLEIIGLEVKNKDAGTFSIQYKKIPYEFSKRKTEERSRNKDPELARRIARRLVKEVTRVIERSNAGDSDANVIIRQAQWYEAMITRLRGEFGGFSDIFADLLGATSPNTPVADNWVNTVDILRRFVRGDFDAQLEALESWLESGGTVAQFKQELPDELITKISGKKYGMNSDKAMKALLGLWRAVKAGDAPKARNFAMNLIGQSEAATIDVWAARLLQRLAGYGRVPPLAEGAVSGSITQTMRPGGQFGFGQDVFEIASDLLAQNGVDFNPRSLQAVAWFLEKEVWTSNGWTNRSGEGGSFEQQMDAMPTKNWQAGYSITQDQPPANASMAEEVNRFEPVLSTDENVYFYRMIPTQGLYAGEGERAFDHEVVAHPDWNPSSWIKKLAEGGKANNQLDVFVSRKITDANEDVPNARPGMEVYFKEPLSAEDAERVMASVREQGVDGFTLTVNPIERRNTADGSEPGAYTGFRVQYVPEIAIRAYEYGWSDSSDPAVQAEYEALTSGDFDRVQDAFSAQQDKMADAVRAVRETPEVAYADTYRYDTSVFGVESYADIIRGSEATNSTPGKNRSEQQVASGLAQAAQRIRSGQRQDAEGDLAQRDTESPDDPLFSRVRRAPFQFDGEERSVGPTGFERGTGGTDSAAQGVGQEESAEDLRRVAQENKRSDVTQGESLEGDGRSFADFFRTVTSGADPTYQPVAPYKPAIPLTPRVQSFKETRAQYRGNFDDHIATSIPGFDEVQSIVGQAIVDTFDGENASVLDVGTSEGALIKAISESSNGRIATLGIDPNPAMEDSFSSLPQSEGASFSLSAFGSAQEAGEVAWTEDDGTKIPFFDPQGQRFDVVHEAMVFQFISNARNAQVSRVKELMEPGGIAIFEQKFGDIATRSDAAEYQKDFEWKSEFYTKEQIEAKRQDVLQRGGDDIEGMNDLMVAHWEMEDVLTSNFDHVAQFWEAGNFRGYVASDNRAVLESFLGNMQDTDTRFARNDMPRAVESSDDVAFMRRGNDPDLDEARRRAGLGGRRRPIAEHIVNLQALVHAHARDRGREFGHAIAQGAFDRFHGIKRIEQQTFGNLPAEQSAYVAARLSTGIASTMRAILHFGAPQWRDGVISRIEGSQGLLQILEPVRGDIDTFLGWMVARRASRLYEEGRENLFEPKHIEALREAGEASPRFEQFETVAARLDDFKKAVLDVAQEAGLIDPEARKAWDMSDYIPFYRMTEEAPGSTGPGSRRGLSGQSSGIRTLRGGVEQLNDPLENLIMNFTHLMDASMKNHAILQLTKNMKGVEGILKQVGPDFKQETIPMEQVRERIIKSGGDPSLIPEQSMQGLAKMYAMKPPADEDVIRVMNKGKAEYYKVLDPMLLKSLTAMHDTGLGFIGIGAMRWTKRLLTRGVTADPSFMARNFMRDMMHAWTINEDKYRLGVDSLRGAAKTLSERGGTIDMMFAGGSFLGGYVNATDPNEVARATRQALRQRGFNAASSRAFLSTIIDSPLKLWEMYTRVGDAIENSSREATYEAARKAGKTRGQAIFEAKDLMDYSMRGSNRVYEFFTDVVPFLNARVQGLYKLGRAGGINPKKVFARGSMIMLGTLALLYENEDDERYQQLPDWDKDTYWHIFPPEMFGTSLPHIRIPKPFEIGVLFATIPERIAQNALDNESNDKTYERFLFAINQTFSFNPVPQAVFPVLEVFSNKDTFRQSPIENMADEGKRPEARYSASTSPTAREFGQFTGENLGISPKELEHLWRGYTGSLGMYALDATDIAVRSWQGEPEQPAKRFDQLPVVRSFLRSEPALSTQMQNDFYELYSQARRDQRTINAYEKDGDVDKAVRLYKESEKLLALLPDMRRVANDLSDIRGEINEIYRSETMSPEEKRDAIDELISLRNEITRSTVPEFKEFIATDPLTE